MPRPTAPATLLTRLRAATEAVVPVAMQVVDPDRRLARTAAAAALGAVVFLGGASQSAAQDVPVTDPSVAMGLPSNQRLPGPGRASGRPPVNVTLNLTENTMWWTDREGFVTLAPQSVDEARAVTRRAKITVLGTLTARYWGASQSERQARQMEETRVFFAGPAVARAMVVLVRGAPGDPAGFPEYTGHGFLHTRATEATPDHQRGDVVRARATSTEQGQREAQGRIDRTVEDAQNRPGQVMENSTRTVLDAIQYGVESTISDVSHGAVWKMKEKIRRRP